jgi:hypothetical protein
MRRRSGRSRRLQNRSADSDPPDRADGEMRAPAKDERHDLPGESIAGETWVALIGIYADTSEVPAVADSPPMEL